VDGKEKEEDLIAHEIAHQWFGNMATEKNFHHLWLSEGFATYLTHRYLETKYGDAVLKARLQTDREKINEFLHRTPRPVVDSTSNYMSLLNANSYEKGGWILHMLRKQVGDSAFHRILQAYYTRYAGKNADTDDFRAVVEAVTGNSWSQFFEQWLHRKQNPSLQVNWKNGGKGKPLEITLRQLQEGPSFEFPLTLELIDLQGNKQRKRLDVKNTEHQFLLPMKAQIASVLIDPDTELLIDRVLITEME
jgi:aminopeptidase N